MIDLPCDLDRHGRNFAMLLDHAVEESMCMIMTIASVWDGNPYKDLQGCIVP